MRQARHSTQGSPPAQLNTAHKLPQHSVAAAEGEMEGEMQGDGMMEGRLWEGTRDGQDARRERQEVGGGARRERQEVGVTQVIRQADTSDVRGHVRETTSAAADPSALASVDLSVASRTSPAVPGMMAAMTMTCRTNSRSAACEPEHAMHASTPDDRPLHLAPNLAVAQNVGGASRAQCQRSLKSNLAHELTQRGLRALDVANSFTNSFTSAITPSP